jgi:hypothetical protein
LSTYILVAATALAVSVSAVVIFADRPAMRKLRLLRASEALPGVS